MEITTFYKCKCANCGEVIEYLAGRAGSVIECPKCKEKSQLPQANKLEMIETFGPATPQTRKCEGCGTELAFAVKSCPVCEAALKRKRQMQIAVAITSVIAIACIAALTVHLLHQAAARRRTIENAEIARKIRSGEMKAPTGPTIIIEQPRPRGPKSIKDFRPGTFVLEQKRGSDFVIAVGDIVNDSENTHYNLRADLDLLDKSGAKIGTVSDYANLLGPHQSWHFISTVDKTNAASIRFASITEKD